MDKKITEYLKSTLKPSDKKIVQLLANGYTAKEVAEQVGLNNRTVEARLLSMRNKFQCQTSVGLVVIFFRNNLIK